MAEKKVKPGSSEELAALFPAATVVDVQLKSIAGEGKEKKVTWEAAQVSIEPLSVVELARLAAVLRPIITDISQAANIMTLAAEHPEEIISAVALAVHWSVEETGRMDAPGFMNVGLAVFQANSDFFTRRLGPHVSGPLATMLGTVGAGQIPSASSSVTGTQPPSDIH